MFGLHFGKKGVKREEEYGQQYGQQVPNMQLGSDNGGAPSRIIGQVIDEETGLPVGVDEYGRRVEMGNMPLVNATWGQDGLLAGGYYAKELMNGRAARVSDAVMAEMLCGVTGCWISKYSSIEDSPNAILHACIVRGVFEEPFQWCGCEIVRVQKDERNMYQVPVYYCPMCGELVMSREGYR